MVIARKPAAAAATAVSPRARRSGAVAAAASSAPRRGTAVKLLSETSSNLLLRDEATGRSTLEGNEAVEYITMALELHFDAMNRLRSDSRRAVGALEHLDMSNASHVEKEAASAVKLQTIGNNVDSIRSIMQDQLTAQQSAQRQRLTQLEQENTLLRRDLLEAREQVEKHVAQSQALRDTLSRKILRTSAMDNILREEINKKIADAKVDLEAMRKSLAQYIETTVLKYHRPQYDTALEAFKEAATRANEDLQRQMALMRGVVDSIGADSALDATKSMHTPTCLRSIAASWSATPKSSCSISLTSSHSKMASWSALAGRCTPTIR